MCIEVALRDFSPFAIATWRITIATAALLPMVWLMRLPMPRDLKTWIQFTATGFLYNAVPFTLISWGQQFISSGTASLVIACGPFIALVLSHFLTHDDRFSYAKLAGVTLGFGGVVVLFGSEALDGSSQALIGQTAVVAALICYILSSLLIRRIVGVQPLVISAGILLTSTVYMVPILFFLADPIPANPGWRSVAASAYLGIVPTGFAYLLRIQIVQRVGAIFLSQVSLVIPIFGLWWVWLFLDEVPARTTWIALALVVSGMWVSRFGTGSPVAAVGRT